MKYIDPLKIQELLITHFNCNNDDGNVILTRELIEKPQSIYDHIYSILHLRNYIYKKLDTYEDIFITNDSHSEGRKLRQEMNLEKFNSGLEFTNPKIFQESLKHSIVVEVNKLIDVMRNFCRKYSGTFELDIDSRWYKYPKNKSGNTAFNKFIKSEYNINRSARNNYYVHDNFNDVNCDQNIFDGYNKLVEDFNQLCHIKDIEDYHTIMIASSETIDFYNTFFEKRVL